MNAVIRTATLQNRYLRRLRRGDGFVYVTTAGRPYRDREGLARIAALAIPPAYTDVYVSPDPEAELQAFGRDARGRLQYRYHPDFVHRNALRKWRRLSRFADALPQMLATAGADLRRSGLPQRKVLALMTRLLHAVYFRVGDESYTRAHRSYGLTTLCKRHVAIEGTQAVFRYRGKHVEHLARCSAGRHSLGVGWKFGQFLLPAVRKFPRQAAFHFNCQRRIGCPVGIQQAAPFAFCLFAGF